MRATLIELQNGIHLYSDVGDVHKWFKMEDQELRSFLNKAGVSHVIDNMLGESLCIINYAAGSTHCWVGIGLLFYTSI